MPDPLVSHLPHRAVLWPFSRQDDEMRDRVKSTPVEIACRWDESQQRYEGGINYQVNVTVDRNIAVGSALWRGTLVSFPGRTNRSGPLDAGSANPIMRVMSYRPTDDIKGMVTNRTVTAQRSTDLWPED